MTEMENLAQLVVKTTARMEVLEELLAAAVALLPPEGREALEIVMGAVGQKHLMSPAEQGEATRAQYHCYQHEEAVRLSQKIAAYSSGFRVA
jgi:hypothetical protein